MSIRLKRKLCILNNELLFVFALTTFLVLLRSGGVSCDTGINTDKELENSIIGVRGRSIGNSEAHIETCTECTCDEGVCRFEYWLDEPFYVRRRTWYVSETSNYQESQLCTRMKCMPVMTYNPKRLSPYVYNAGSVDRVKEFRRIVEISNLLEKYDHDCPDCKKCESNFIPLGLRRYITVYENGTSITSECPAGTLAGRDKCVSVPPKGCFQSDSCDNVLCDPKVGCTQNQDVIQVSLLLWMMNDDVIKDKPDYTHAPEKPGFESCLRPVSSKLTKYTITKTIKKEFVDVKCSHTDRSSCMVKSDRSIASVNPYPKKCIAKVHHHGKKVNIESSKGCYFTSLSARSNLDTHVLLKNDISCPEVDIFGFCVNYFTVDMIVTLALFLPMGYLMFESRKLLVTVLLLSSALKVRSLSVSQVKWDVDKELITVSFDESYDGFTLKAKFETCDGVPSPSSEWKGEAVFDAKCGNLITLVATSTDQELTFHPQVFKTSVKCIEDMSNVRKSVPAFFNIGDSSLCSLTEGTLIGISIMNGLTTMGLYAFLSRLVGGAYAYEEHCIYESWSYHYITGFLMCLFFRNKDYRMMAVLCATLLLIPANGEVVSLSNGKILSCEKGSPGSCRATFSTTLNSILDPSGCETLSISADENSLATTLRICITLSSETPYESKHYFPCVPYAVTTRHGFSCYLGGKEADTVKDICKAPQARIVTKGDCSKTCGCAACGCFSCAQSWTCCTATVQCPPGCEVWVFSKAQKTRKVTSVTVTQMTHETSDGGHPVKICSVGLLMFGNYNPEGCYKDVTFINSTSYKCKNVQGTEMTLRMSMCEVCYMGNTIYGVAQTEECVTQCFMSEGRSICLKEGTEEHDLSPSDVVAEMLSGDLRVKENTITSLSNSVISIQSRVDISCNGSVHYMKAGTLMVSEEVKDSLTMLLIPNQVSCVVNTWKEIRSAHEECGVPPCSQDSELITYSSQFEGIPDVTVNMGSGQLRVIVDENNGVGEEPENIVNVFSNAGGWEPVFRVYKGPHPTTRSCERGHSMTCQKSGSGYSIPLMAATCLDLSFNEAGCRVTAPEVLSRMEWLAGEPYTATIEDHRFQYMRENVMLPGTQCYSNFWPSEALSDNIMFYTLNARRNIRLSTVTGIIIQGNVTISDIEASLEIKDVECLNSMYITGLKLAVVVVRVESAGDPMVKKMKVNDVYVDTSILPGSHTVRQLVPYEKTMDISIDGVSCQTETVVLPSLEVPEGVIGAFFNQTNINSQGLGGFSFGSFGLTLPSIGKWLGVGIVVLGIAILLYILLSVRKKTKGD